MRGETMKKLAFGVVACTVLSSTAALAAPMSDGSIYKETFENYPEDPKSAMVGPNANRNFDANFTWSALIQTEDVTEGVMRAHSLAIPAGSEYVVEYDVKVNGASGNNFYLYFSEGAGSPWNSDVAMRIFEDGSSNWGFQVDYGSGQYEAFLGMEYGDTYHLTVHHKTDNMIDVYLDGGLLGSYADRAASIGTSLIQFGDPSSGVGYGDMNIDNISIGAVAIPEPAALGLIGLGSLLCVRRRRH